MNKYEFYSTILQEDFPVKYREVIADNDSEQRKEIRELRETLARVEEELAEALGLLVEAVDDAKLFLATDLAWKRYGNEIDEIEARYDNFLARHAQAEQKEACDYCGPGKHTGLPGAACEKCMNTGLKYPEQEAQGDGQQS